MKDRCVVFFEKDKGLAEKICKALDADLLGFEEKQVFKEAWGYSVVVVVAATGIVVRKIKSMIKDKWSDPSVLAVDANGDFCIPVIGGHHRGNEAAYKLAQKLEMVPVVTTATERKGKWSVEGLVKDLDGELVGEESTVKTNMSILETGGSVEKISGPRIILAESNVSLVKRKKNGLTIGLGCRKNVSREKIVEAVETVLEKNRLSAEDVELLATVSLKKGEKGLEEAANHLNLPLFFLDKKTLKRFPGPSGSEAERIGLPGVAEPAALASSQKEELVVEKTVRGPVTVAIAK